MANPKYAAAEKALPAAELVTTLEDGRRVKRRAPRMRACDEKDDKGKLCAGHLKRWSTADSALIRRFGNEIYRCEKCRSLYLPHPDEEPRTGTLSW